MVCLLAELVAHVHHVVASVLGGQPPVHNVHHMRKTIVIDSLERYHQWFCLEGFLHKGNSREGE
jgi:hypothetical protein